MSGVGCQLPAYLSDTGHPFEIRLGEIPTAKNTVHRQYNEDLFENTKMTFGEHLEELRGSLVKATIALVVGVLIGLIFAGDVVDYVQTPLKAALEEYYIRLETEEFRAYLEQQRLEGKPVP